MKRLITRQFVQLGLVGLLAWLGLSGRALAQQEVETARRYLANNAAKQGITSADVEQSTVSSAYLSPTTGWYHVYFNQAVQQIDVHNRLLNVVVKGDQVAYATNNYVPSVLSVPQVGSLKSRIDPLVALQLAATNVGFTVENLAGLQEVSSQQLADGTLTKRQYAVPALSADNVDVKLYWLPQTVTVQTGKVVDKLVLVWQVRFLTKDGKAAWNIHVSAATGEVVRKVDEMIRCNFGTPEHTTAPHVCSGNAATFGLLKRPFAANSYTVFDYPLEAPTFGGRSVSTNPYARFAPAGTGPGATNGWHNDGSTTYTTTRGNNVWAQEDTNADNLPGNSPSSATLEFDHPYTFGMNTAAGNQNAAITNLFYWNNLLHDVLWRYGFDEPSGNFQQSNLGRGGVDGDYVVADAQDGSGYNNANFAASPDGNRGRMQMYLWNYSNDYQADSDFDNGIIAHEYGHGWSMRLTGGPATTSCLQNLEQGGEGWSDYLALMLTTNWASLSPTLASANLPRGIGTYALGQSTTGAGIRPYRYSYDMANVNAPVTYARVADYAVPHGIGSIWATMLWDMTWAIIMQDGRIEADIYTTPSSVTAMRGNIAALKLVNEGLRLQPCSPSFVQARDAILQADQLLFGGRYRCAIGQAFARRGLGANASTGASSDDRLVTEDFTPIGGVGLSSPTTTTACSGAPFVYTAATGVAGVTFSWNRPAVTGISNASASGGTATVNESLINTSNVPITVIYYFTGTPDPCAGAAGIPQPVSVVVYPQVTPLVSSYTVAQNATVPSGQGLRVRPFTVSSLADVLSPTSGTYVRGSGDNTTTYAPGTSVYYRSYTFVAPVSGPVTFEVTSATFTANDNDTYMSLYQTAFDPASPAANFLRGDDDSGTGTLSLLTHSLTQGSTYVLVVAAFNANVTGLFQLQANYPVFEPTQANSVDGVILSSSGTYNRPGGGNTTVYYASGTPTYYKSYTVVAPTSGPVTFELTAASLNDSYNDTYMALYQTSFNAASPELNFLHADDDDGVGVLSKITHTLTQGATYVVVVTTYESGVTGTFTLQSSQSLFPAGNSIGWFKNPVGGQPLATGYVFNPVGVAGSGIPNTATPGTTTFYVSRTDSPTCRSATTFTIGSTTVESVQVGAWNVPGTWTCNCIPDNTMPVRILNTHTVTIPDAYTGQAKSIQFVGNGSVRMLGTGKVKLGN